MIWQKQKWNDNEWSCLCTPSRLHCHWNICDIFITIKYSRWELCLLLYNMGVRSTCTLYSARINHTDNYPCLLDALIFYMSSYGFFWAIQAMLLYSLFAHGQNWLGCFHTFFKYRKFVKTHWFEDMCIFHHHTRGIISYSDQAWACVQNGITQRGRLADGNMTTSP